MKTRNARCSGSAAQALCLTLLLLGACSRGGQDGPSPAASAASGPGPGLVANRAAELRRAIETSRVRTGHAALPQRAITHEGLLQVSKSLHAADSPALVQLISDQDPAVRIAAAWLLSCIHADPDRLLAQAMADETAQDKRQYLDTARLELRVDLAGGTQCRQP